MKIYIIEAVRNADANVAQITEAFTALMAHPQKGA